uniref:MTH538 TIR-like domain (DUF1863) n=1 Tax=Candidatus Kentrum eta TaxID=2126337 RepID=A0A450U6E0_9GAMM|nr:MAG: MTH538 TIR-like domain (DUF1863) [Candidatus Kentron sp. H]VFJ88719.1 MAG: MTH538 TIR-like domain (DUF1863) [Candidatus Kentron sp. H]VFJ94990.1 MAG: MTH538 TIR-like domain (DUF1863) [Candidatus Kentron sp. H]
MHFLRISALSTSNNGRTSWEIANKVFVSYHHANDQYYRDRFERLFDYHYDIMVSESVQMGDIDPNLQTETVRQKIRDEYLRNPTVTVVLIGAKTWQRKHVDWEIGMSIRDTEKNPRAGLLGIFLPTHPDYGRDRYNPHIIPPRLYDNVQCEFAKLYHWTESPNRIQSWIHEAFKRRYEITPNNSYPSFKNNRSGTGWQ